MSSPALVLEYTGEHTHADIATISVKKNRTRDDVDKATDGVLVLMKGDTDTPEGGSAPGEWRTERSNLVWLNG